MAKRDKDTLPQDDGRTVADMSDLAPHRNWLGGWTDSAPGTSRRELSQPEPPREDRPWEQAPEFDREQRFWAIMGALKAALLIGLAYVVGLGLLVWLMLQFWH